MTKFIVNKRTDALKTDINDNRLSNYPLSLVDASRIINSSVYPHIDNTNKPMSAREFIQLS